MTDVKGTAYSSRQTELMYMPEHDECMCHKQF